MDNITVNMENLSEEERASLVALIEKANKPQSKVWKPKEGELYYRINCEGDMWADCAENIWSDTWTNHKYDIASYEIGNCFQTKEEAEEKVKELKVKAKWKRLSIESGEKEDEWNDTNDHWACLYDSSTHKMLCVPYTWDKGECTYFDTKESIEAAIKEIGEENVKRYILGIK